MISDICIVQGCTNTIKIKQHKLCRSHYMRYYRHGTVDSIKPLRKNRKLKLFKGEHDNGSRKGKPRASHK